MMTMPPFELAAPTVADTLDAWMEEASAKPSQSKGSERFIATHPKFPRLKGIDERSPGHALARLRQKIAEAMGKGALR